MVYFAAAIIIPAITFYLTNGLLNYLAPPIEEPDYDVSSLPFVSSGQHVDATNPQYWRAFLSGWSKVDELGRWSDGREAFLGFRVAGTRPQDVPTGIIVHANVYLAPPALTKQHVQVWSNGVLIANYEFDKSSVDLAIPLAPLRLSVGRALVVGFYLPDASSPKAMQHASDPRLLGLYVHSLDFIR